MTTRRRGMCLVLIALLGLSTLIPRACASEPDSEEYRLKAVYLYNFTKFVNWPAGHLPSPDSPIVIGILGRNPFGGELERIVRDRRVNGRPVVVQTVATPEEAASVQVLFVVAGGEAAMEPMREILRKGHVLTVGESPEFTALGGIITYVLYEGKIRFAVNLSAGKRAGLDIRAQLLNLASEVKTGG